MSLVNGTYYLTYDVVKWAKKNNCFGIMEIIFPNVEDDMIKYLWENPEKILSYSEVLVEWYERDDHDESTCRI